MDIEKPFQKFKEVSLAYKLSLNVVDTLKYCNRMKEVLETKVGVKVLQGEVTSINFDAGTITGIEYTTSENKTEKVSGFDKYLICGGVESVFLGAKLGLKVPIYGFKGHSLNYYTTSKDMLKNSYIFLPDNIAVAKVGVGTNNLVRFTGFADVVGINWDTIEERKQKVVSMAKELLGEENYDESKANHWVGLRPVCADDVAIIGKSTKFSNLFWNTGHGARGITHCPSSCDLISGIMLNQGLPEQLNPSDYSPSRFNL